MGCAGECGAGQVLLDDGLIWCGGFLILADFSTMNLLHQNKIDIKMTTIPSPRQLYAREHVLVACFLSLYLLLQFCPFLPDLALAWANTGLGSLPASNL